MVSPLKLSRSTYWFIGAALLILSVDSAVVHTLKDEPLLAYAILFDFILVVPLLYWLLVIRRSGRKLKALLPLPVLGALAAWFILPSSLKGTVWHTIWPIELLIVTAEAAIIFYEARLIVRVVKKFRLIRRAESNTGEAIRLAVQEVLGTGKLTSVITHDASMIYYLFFSWGARKRMLLQTEGEGYSFTYHKETNQVMMAAFATKIIVMESVVVHLLLAMWSPLAAWIVTISEIWLLMLLWADTRAAVLQPIRMDSNGLRLRYGLRLQGDLQWSDISSIEWAKAGYELDDAERKRSAGPVLGTPNVKLELHREKRIEGLLFLPKQTRIIYLTVDEPQKLVEQARVYTAQ
ncbi:hypothetical protein [Paenibacillus radicis (ex Gao et al. 2016)]|uniref:Beta-carotene 15,15'-monooxygenase n=1 Tax=Paenibacillus radicis (ex Gao et al. 2016) TaxID=1737354 RepID=A0A917GWX8_9BACL|nr:hypothetical protein [Paenibacillus radicis (ex Gao et al. 2016)]GGG60001.1 hypothetical protein GCM10010918_11540 [Paenibacillus radicis (ex Gao et al. 2016)]